MDHRQGGAWSLLRAEQSAVYLSVVSEFQCSLSSVEGSHTPLSHSAAGFLSCWLDS